MFSSPPKKPLLHPKMVSSWLHAWLTVGERFLYSWHVANANISADLVIGGLNPGLCELKVDWNFNDPKGCRSINRVLWRCVYVSRAAVVVSRIVWRYFVVVASFLRACCCCCCCCRRFSMLPASQGHSPVINKRLQSVASPDFDIMADRDVTRN